jgi:hypothetical protein
MYYSTKNITQIVLTAYGVGLASSFARIVLIVLVACTISVIVFLAMLPGMIAKNREHPW